MTILNFEHRQSGHCESGVISNLLNYHGFKLSEPMAFGIGSGIFFSHLPFMKMQHAPITTFRVWPGLIFKRISKRLKIKSFIHTYRNEKESMDDLIRALDQGYPVGLQVGIYHLPFFPPEYRMHFNGHNLVVYGYDGDLFYVSDTVIDRKVEIRYDDLVRVRFAKGVMAPRGRLYYPVEIPKDQDIRPAVSLGIRQAAKHMVDIPFPLIGTKGMRFLSNRMRTWEQKLGPKTAAYYLGQVLRMEEEIGTAGAGFRFLYGAFLNEAADVLGKPALKEAAAEMGENANKWREFSYIGARNCKKRAKPEESYDMLADMVLECADREERIFRSLLKIVKD